MLRDRGLRKVRSRKRAGVSSSPGSFSCLRVSENIICRKPTFREEPYLLQERGYLG